jgi:lactonase
MDVKQLPKLEYQQGDFFVPLFNGEANLQIVVAEPWLKVSDKDLFLEGLCFDRHDDLYFVSTYEGAVYKCTFPSKEIRLIYRLPGFAPTAVKIHKDGRLFVCGLGDSASAGGVLAMNPDGSNVEEIVSRNAGYCVDDLVFDEKGGFYFTDLRGFVTDPTGGVYYVSPDFRTITPILKNMAAANGVSLSKDGRILWATELNANRLHRVHLLEDGTEIAPFGASVPYTFTGHHGPDSTCIDNDDNIYVAMYEQGRVLVFNKTGNPIGQILIPGREHGHMLFSTHPAFIPGTDQLLICSSDGNKGHGAWIYIARGFATGHLGYQFR